MTEIGKLGTLTNGDLAIDCCNLGNSTPCLGNSEVKNILENPFDKNMVEKITFHQWVTADQCSLKTI